MLILCTITAVNVRLASLDLCVSTIYVNATRHYAEISVHVIWATTASLSAAAIKFTLVSFVKLVSATISEGCSLDVDLRFRCSPLLSQPMHEQWHMYSTRE